MLIGTTEINAVAFPTFVAHGGRYLKVVVSCMQGWRISMEDAHSNFLSLPGDPTAAFFAVFDGHGGSAVAQHTSQHLHKKIVQQLHYSKFLCLCFVRVLLMALSPQHGTSHILYLNPNAHGVG